MTPERYRRIGQIFDETLELPSEKRSAYLKQACAEDPTLLGEVEKLLANHFESQTFLSRPAAEIAAEMLAKNHAPLAAGKQIGHYKILSPLGAGGMGEVYLAEDIRLKRKVALKVLPAMLAQDKDRLMRFEQEALASSALNHPNILTIYEFATEGETQFLATEFIDGETVHSRLKRERLSLAEALDIAIQCAQALAAAHAAGIIHRDIKPDNVMIRKDGIVRVLDFGLAKLVPQAPLDTEAETKMQMLTQDGTVLGTAAYMSPEQARGRTVDARTDIFSFGVVLYEMVARRHPFIGETANHTMVAILEKEPPPLAQVVKDVPFALEQIIERTLAKLPDDRYSSASELLTDLKRLQKHLEISSDAANTSARHNFEAETQILQDNGPNPVDQTAARTPVVSRKRTGLLLIGGLAVLMIIGIVTWQAFRPGPIAAPVQTITALPERNFTYSLTVQRYRDGAPYKEKFQSTGREIFESGWKFRFNLTSPQDGYLYLINQETDGKYRLLFPLPSRDNGSAYVKADERLETRFYDFDGNPGTEQFRVVWATQSVPQLERLRRLVNAMDQGLISNAGDIQSVKEFIQQQAASSVEMNEDSDNKQIKVHGQGPILVSLVKLEHR